MRTNSSSRITWGRLLGVLLAVCGLFACWPFRFHSYSICSRCGAVERTTEWQLPRNQVSFFSHSAIEDTPVSSYLLSSGSIGPHRHEWMFGHGSGNGVGCALGNGDLIAPTMTSSNVPHLLAFSRRFGEEKESDNLLKLAFDKEVSRTIGFVASELPKSGFTSREQYRSWMENETFIITNAVEIAKQAR